MSHCDCETCRRRAWAEEHPTVWRVGGSRGTSGHTIYLGPRLIGMVLDPAVAEQICEVMNGAPVRD